MITENIIGIDPGFTGGIAIVNRQFELVDAWQMPTDKPLNTTEIVYARLAEMIESARSGTCYIENVTSRPRQANVFRFGFATGVAHGILGSLGIDIKLVAPARWKAGVGLPIRREETTTVVKARSRALASKIWPQHADKFKRTTDDGAAEAALIALYGAGQEAQ